MADAPPPPAPPAAEPWPEIVPPVAPPPAGVVGGISVVLAGLSLLAYLVAGILLVVPVETPQVQDCGAPGAFLLGGRLNTFPDEENRIRDADDEIVTLDADVADAARANPCSDRVADRGYPAALLLTAATVLGLVAFGLQLFVVRPRQRRTIRAAMAADPTPQGVPPGEDPGIPGS